MTCWLFLHGLILLILIGTVLSLITNLVFFPRLAEAGGGETGPPPLVSVLVPARNEARRIAACARSLLAQNHANFELLILDDNSEDETSAILRDLGFSEVNERARLLHGTPLPTGWVGKCWACHQLAGQARGEFLLFTDADTVHASGSVSSAVALAQQTSADLLSAWPRLITKSLGEKLIIPVLHIMALGWFPIWLLDFLQKDPTRARKLPLGFLRALGGANGQFLLFRRSAYDAIGGHAAVRNHLVEDVALGREVAQRIGDGMRLINCDASRLVDCRMYESFRETWDGFTKNARPAFENAHAIWWGIGAAQFGAFFLPFILVWFHPQRSTALGEIALIYLIRIIIAWRMQTSWLGALLHPFGHALAMTIGLNSWRLSARRGVVWKGRTYRTE